MKINNMEDKINLLGSIRKVDAPPFLFTRIQQKIEGLSEERFSPSAIWGLAATFALIVTLNVAVVLSNYQPIDKLTSLAEQLRILPSDDIYQ